MERRPDHDPIERVERRHDGADVDRRDSDDFFGLDVDGMSARALVVTALAVLVPVVLGGAFVLAVAPEMWWLIFVFGWVIFPAFGLFVKGVAGLSEGEGRPGLAAGGDKERELLGALRERGEISPTQAAMQTSLSVAEADSMLSELAEGGHLRVLVRGGGLFYSLWDGTEGERAGRLEGS